MTVQSSEVASRAVLHKRFWERACFGAVAGFRLGLYYAVLMVIVVPLVNTDGRHSEHPISLVRALLGGLLYLPFAGAMINIARPWIRDVFGAALTGCAVVLPLLLTIALSARGLHRWSLDFALTTAALIFLIGSFFGSVVWLSRSRYRGNWWDGE